MLLESSGTVAGHGVESLVVQAAAPAHKIHKGFLRRAQARRLLQRMMQKVRATHTSWRHASFHGGRAESFYKSRDTCNVLEIFIRKISGSQLNRELRLNETHYAEDRKRIEHTRQGVVIL